MTSPEERALTLANLDLVFPGKFTSETEVSDVYVMHELRTQIFVQHFLEEGGSEDWDTTIQLGEIFKVDDLRSLAAAGVHYPPIPSLAWTETVATRCVQECCRSQNVCGMRPSPWDLGGELMG